MEKALLKALLIVNPHARRGRQRLDEAIAQLEAAGLDLIEVDLDSPQQIPELILKYAPQVDKVIVGGGDGTLNTAIAPLVETRLPLGILPLGTANDLARTLAIPPNLAVACEAIANGRLEYIDLGWVNGCYFFNIASLGMSVQIAQQVNKSAKRYLGMLAYGATALSLLVQQRPFKAEIRVDDRELGSVESMQISVGNGRYYGGGMTIAHDAAIADQRLDLYSIEIEHWWQIMRLLPALRSGNFPQSQQVRVDRGTEIEIRTDTPVAINTDGEITTQTPAVFRVLPRALAVCLPANARDI